MASASRTALAGTGLQLDGGLGRVLADLNDGNAERCLYVHLVQLGATTPPVVTQVSLSQVVPVPVDDGRVESSEASETAHAPLMRMHSVMQADLGVAVPIMRQISTPAPTRSHSQGRVPEDTVVWTLAGVPATVELPSAEHAVLRIPLPVALGGNVQEGHPKLWAVGGNPSQVCAEVILRPTFLSYSLFSFFLSPTTLPLLMV